MVIFVVQTMVIFMMPWSAPPGLPYSFYHGRTGIVFNVNRNALGALALTWITATMGAQMFRMDQVSWPIMFDRDGQEQVSSPSVLLIFRMPLRRVEHVRKSRCNEAFKHRVKDNDLKKQQAKKEGKSIVCKREPAEFLGRWDVQILAQVLAPLPFVENYF
eukprot:Skav225311  [mRNA]  locus=scaffold4899:56766:61793:- [translate_table: standard]